MYHAGQNLEVTSINLIEYGGVGGVEREGRKREGFGVEDGD